MRRGIELKAVRGKGRVVVDFFLFDSDLLSETGCLLWRRKIIVSETHERISSLPG